MRRILITNDDGIGSDGLRRLVEAAVKLGEVWVVAPEKECSAMSHRILLREPIDVHPYDFPVAGVKAFSTSGTPADCVRFGLLNIVKGSVDVVLSGINFGFNCGSDLQYSATVGAAMEAASVGVRAIALSEGMGDCHEVTDDCLDEILQTYIDEELPFNQILNINFPWCKRSEFKGILTDRIVARNAFYHDTYVEEPLPDGGIRLRVSGEYYEDASLSTDVRAVIDGYISIGMVRNLC